MNQPAFAKDAVTHRLKVDLVLARESLVNTKDVAAVLTEIIAENIEAKGVNISSVGKVTIWS